MADGEDTAELVATLSRRVKELTALHRCAKILLRPDATTDELFAAVAALLPLAFLQPEGATGCVRFDGRAYPTPGHAPTPWTLTHRFVTGDGRRGGLEVAYHAPRPDVGAGLGPFAVEEARLLASLSDMLCGALDRRLAEAQTRRASDRLNLALTAALMGVWEWDLASDTVVWSAHLTRLVGHDGELVGQRNDFSDLIHPDDRVHVAASRDAIREPDRTYSFEFRLRRPDGGWRPVAATGRVGLDDRGQPDRVLGVIMDIGARRALESGLQQAQRLEVLGQLAGSIAHDFNNVLCVVQADCDELLLGLVDGPVREQIEEIQAAALSGAALTRQLLTFSRKAEFHPTAIALDPLVRSLQPLLGRLAGRAIAMRTSLAAAGARVWADASQLEQVLMNLIANARDAMPGGGTVTVATELREGADPPEVAIIVGDTGPGISADLVERLFEPFFTTKPPGQGTGLGLAVVRAVARRWQGDVTVESTPGHGATFRVRLPLHRDE